MILCGGKETKQSKAKKMRQSFHFHDLISDYLLSLSFSICLILRLSEKPLTISPIQCVIRFTGQDMAAPEISSLPVRSTLVILANCSYKLILARSAPLSTSFGKSSKLQ